KSITSMSQKIGKLDGPVREALEKIGELMTDLGRDFFTNFDGMWKEGADGGSISSQQANAFDTYLELQSFLALIANIHIYQRKWRKGKVTVPHTVPKPVLIPDELKGNPLEFANKSILSPLSFENETPIKE
ncbi:hypothetical protein PMAYCL1PPCAC_25726, partial [Pristionchus mayeri]